MRVFITGGTGYIGSAIVRELASAGHEVTALSRSPDKSAHLERLSATPIEGDISDPSTYQATAAGHDAVVHAAMDYMGDPADMVKGDAIAIDALLERNPNVSPDEVEDVIVGIAMHDGEQGGNMARLSVALSKLPITTAGSTINRFCSSGVQSIR